MSTDEPVACSLGAADLERRLRAIAAVGADSLISREVDGGRHRLRFRASSATRRRLGEIVVGEAQCCAFLDLSLSTEGWRAAALDRCARRRASGGGRPRRRIRTFGLSAHFAACTLRRFVRMVGD